MKLKINKACDLSSISVLPPQSRRSNVISSGSDSIFGKSQASQLRSQQSQQSFSQGMSQLSQNSLDDILTNDQRFCSQGENTARRTSCLAPVAYNREETQLTVSRSSNNHLRRWGSASVQDTRCQVSEELEHRIGMIETSLSRFGMMLDSVQGDVMQVNKAIKEVAIETEGIRKKLASQDSSLQLMLKGEEDIKASLDGSFKCIPIQLRKDLEQYRLQEIASTVLSLPDQIKVQLQKIQSALCGDITKELEAIAKSVKIQNQKNTSPTPPEARANTVMLQNDKNTSSTTPQERSFHIQSQKEPQLVVKSPVAPPISKPQRTPVPEIKDENQGFIRPKKYVYTRRRHNIKQKQDELSFAEQNRNSRTIIELDEEMDVGFSCLLDAKETGMGVELVDDVKGETERILRKARRRKRKSLHPIIYV